MQNNKKVSEGQEINRELDSSNNKLYKEAESNDKEKTAAVQTGENGEEITDDMDSIKAELHTKSKQCEEYFNMLQRTAAEFDNYKKRTAREKEALYTDAVSDVVLAFLPVIDSIERAIKACSGQEDEQSIKEGIELVYKQVKEVFKKLGVEEIEAVDGDFDPYLHEAVMHVKDESKGKNIVVEEFLKGYTLKDRIIRHSIVKVAN